MRTIADCRLRIADLVIIAAMLVGTAAHAEDWPMWGRTPDRNMVSHEKNPPTDWSVEGKKNIKWVSSLGSQTYGNAVVYGGLVFIGTNNEGRREPKYNADGGVLMCFRESDGEFLWQQYSAKLASGRVNDWPYQGVCSTPLIEDDKLWYCTNRCEVVCLDIEPLRRGDKEAKTVWKVDMMSELGVFPHNMTSCSPLAYKDYLYIITGNGVDDTHKNLPAPKAPAIVCFNKKTGKVVWTDNSPGEVIYHGQWASPTLAIVNGKPQILAPLGDSYVYSFEPETGKIIWKFDTNWKHTVYPAVRNELIATPLVWDNKMYIATGQDPEHGEGVGIFWCVDITKTGDVSMELATPTTQPNAPREGGGAKGIPNPNSAVVWHFEKAASKTGAKAKGKDLFHRSISNAALDVEKGLLFIPDFSGFLHCFDAKTGERYWVYDTEAAMWGTPLLVDGKIYLGDEGGFVRIFESSKKLTKIADIDMGSPVYRAPIFANGVLYFATRDKLWAIQEK